MSRTPQWPRARALSAVATLAFSIGCIDRVTDPTPVQANPSQFRADVLAHGEATASARWSAIAPAARAGERHRRTARRNGGIRRRGSRRALHRDAGRRAREDRWIRCRVDGHSPDGPRLLVQRLRSSAAAAASAPRSDAAFFLKSGDQFRPGPPPTVGSPA